MGNLQGGISSIRRLEGIYTEALKEARGEGCKIASMSSEGVLEILNLIRSLKSGKPKVLELGTGFSTIAIHMLSDAKVISLDHSLEWISFMIERILPAFSLKLPAPSMMLFPRQPSCLGKYDVIIVDHGPELQTRADDLPWITRCLAPDGVMVFDDWRPKHEGRIRRGLDKLGKFNIRSLEHTRRCEKDKAIAYAMRIG